jgi:hypothetical protein
MKLDAASEAYVEAVRRRVQDNLGSALVGVYLHGSAVLGGFNRRRSDIDILAVSYGEVSRAQKRELAIALSHATLPCPAVGLEFSLVTQASADVPVKAPLFELDMTTGPGKEDKITYGEDYGGSADYLMHYAVCRANGRALWGGPPTEVFADVPRQWLLEAFARELEWAEVNAPFPYQVLNACRAWRFVEDDLLVSKIEGAKWARERVQDPALIDKALTWQGGGPEQIFDPTEVSGALRDVLLKLRRAAQEGTRSGAKRAHA